MLRRLQQAFTIAGVGALAYCAMVWFAAERFQARQARLFLEQIQSGARAATRPRVIPVEGEIVGKIEIPRLGVSVMVTEGVDGPDLSRAVGHIPGTSFPWQRGNVGIAGHRDTYFRPLSSILPRDVITLSTLAGAYRYRVISTGIVNPDDVKVLARGRRDLLTLVTCYPFYYVGAAPMRFIVRAVRS